MKQTAGETINPSDILQIYHILGEQGRIRPVIAPKIKIFKHRSKNDVKKQLTMHEDITHQNAVLLQLLNNEFKAPDITTENICVR